MDTLRTDAVEIVDQHGRVRARLGIAPDGGVALDLADESGLIRATLNVEADQARRR